MQNHRSSAGPFPETLSFSNASTSDDTNINQLISFNNTENSGNNNTTLQDYLTSIDDPTIIFPHFTTQQGNIFNSHNAIPEDFNIGTENADHDGDDCRILEMPPVTFNTSTDPIWGPPSGSDNLLDNYRISGKRKSLERTVRQFSRGESSSNFQQSQGSVCANNSSRSLSASNNLQNLNTFSSDNLLLNNLSPERQPGPIQVASSRRTQNALRNRNLSSSRERIQVPNEEPNPITLPINNFQNSVENSGGSVENSGGSIAGVHLPNRPQFPRRLSELVRRSLLDSPDNRGRRLLNSRPSLLLDRQIDGNIDLPNSLRDMASAGEGRSRLVSEIRNVLDLVRRGENLRFEDVALFDHSMLFEMINLHDRHRDMRLDIDNMSYEELLALEERIGNVNTGLNDENISNKMVQRKFISVAKSTETQVEPCCVCQEEYNEGEDVGRLECGHEFHSDCIKQWLKQKNLCPTCKTTALTI